MSSVHPGSVSTVDATRDKIIWFAIGEITLAWPMIVVAAPVHV